MEGAQRELEQRILELEQELHGLHHTGSSSDAVDSADSTAAGTPAGTGGGRRGARVVYIQPSEKVPKFSGSPERADSPTLEEWIEIIENHVQLKPTEKEKAIWYI